MAADYVSLAPTGKWEINQMSNISSALDHIQSALSFLGTELGTLVHSVGIDGIPTILLSEGINALTEVAKKLGELPPLA